jgi:N-acetyl-anhydromuramyl-L-alanine amidase AmpD
MNIIRRIIKERFFIDPEDGKRKSRYGHRGNNAIAWIVVHYTGGRKDNGRAKTTADAMQTWKRTVSTHYLVGDDGIYQTVEERNTAWHCGGYKASNKCAASNGVAIGVDLVNHKKNTKTGSVNDRDWYFSDKVLNDGAQLVAELADKYSIPMDHIVRHFDVTGKWCPRPFVGNDINEVTGKTGNDAWLSFIALVNSLRKTS